jgi:serine/threonine protein kinase
LSETSPNTTLAHYTILSKLGAGGMGEVYLAQDTKLDRKVAIKFLKEEFSRGVDKLKRFVQEAKAASALNHPNILTVYEIGEIDGKNYIATELIEGHTLRLHLTQKEALPLNSILKIGVQVAEALTAAHQAGIIHRDIKPENIMLRPDGYAKVLAVSLRLGLRDQF